MDDRLTISTPEQVAFHYEVAGIGSRFVAAILDHLILAAVLYFVSCGGSFVIGWLSEAVTGEAAVYIVLALLVIVIFLVLWGYFALFEIVWNGQTPGKRANNLRVIRRDGQPVRAGEAIIRNLVRLVDFLPGFYGIGLIIMFVDKESRRLGDLAAGTLVVREPVHTRFSSIRLPSTPAAYNPSSDARPSGGYNPQAAATAYDPLPGVSLRELTPEDYRLIREMITRYRLGEIPRNRAEDLAARLAEGVASRLGHDFSEWQRRGWHPVVFLESVLASQDARSR